MRFIKLPVAFVLLLLCIPNSTFCQLRENICYKVDSSIRQSISQHIDHFDGAANGRIFLVAVKTEQSDSLVTDTLDSGALCFTYFDKGFAGITCTDGLDEGMGFMISLSDAECWARLYIFEIIDTPRFKLAQDDNAVFELTVPSVESTVTFVKMEKDLQGKVLEGSVELKSDWFYAIKDGEEARMRVELRGYFRSEPMPVINKRYKTLKKRQ